LENVYATVAFTYEINKYCNIPGIDREVRLERISAWTISVYYSGFLTANSL